MKHFLFIAISIFFGQHLFSQSRGVGIGTASPHNSAVLELKDTARGFLPPRLTYAQRTTIPNPAVGLLIWCSDCLPNGEIQVFNGASWTNTMGGTAATNYVQLPSVMIGNQVWSSKNLDVSNYRNGDAIPQVTDAVQWSTLTTGAWCWYNNDSATYAATYGKLYNWYAVNDPRGLAPIGWHVSTSYDWNKLTKYLDFAADTICSGCYQSTTAGGALKQSGTVNWSSPNTGATNSTGFTALPGGYRFHYGDFTYIKYAGNWWTTSEWDAISAWSRPLNFNDANTFKSVDYKRQGNSVRLVRN